ncbi:MAG: helix-turn-helix domain-containing protein [Alphaproteobacteria bacterium]|nr:helix-turn-helix domain-containing protein [Alphaproteobacteria bacterium]
MSQNNNKKYLTQQEVAQILNVQSKTITHWRAMKNEKIKDLKYIKLGRVILYPEQEFFQWLDSHMQNTAKEDGYAQN